MTWIKLIVETTTPMAHGLSGRLWNARKLRAVLISCVLSICTVSISTVCQWLGRLSLSFKKTKKLLRKADPLKRAAFLERFQTLWPSVADGSRTLVYIDEVHIHQDMDLGYGWARKGIPFYIPSSSPGLPAKINWYGAYDFSNGQAMIWAYPKCNGENTADFLRRLVAWLGDKPNVTVIWDGAPVHYAKVATQAAKELGIELVVLPAYSPDLNPIEGLWKWMREEVTQGYCHPTLRSLFDECLAFIARINQDPNAMNIRLWPKLDLKPAEEKLRIPK